MWSLLYVLIEFLTGTLPWKGKEKEAIRDLKIDAHKSKWIEQYPQPIVSFYRHVDTLGYESPPDYDYLVGLFAEWTAQPAQLDWESTQSDNTEPLVALAADPESMADGDDLSAEMQLDDHRVPITSPVHKPKFRNANLDRQIASAPLGGHSGALDCENRTLNRKSCIDIMIVEDTKKYILSFQ